MIIFTLTSGSFLPSPKDNTWSNIPMSKKESKNGARTFLKRPEVETTHSVKCSTEVFPAEKETHLQTS